jgi:hypothetical protein
VDCAGGVYHSSARAYQIRIMTRESDPKKLNLGLFRSIQLHMEFGLLMIAAFLTAAFTGW